MQERPRRHGRFRRTAAHHRYAAGHLRRKTNRCQRAHLHRAQHQDRGGRNLLDRGEGADVLQSMILQSMIDRISGSKQAGHRCTGGNGGGRSMKNFVACWNVAELAAYGDRAHARARGRHDLRARAQRRQGAAELAAAPRQLPGPPVLGAQGDQHRQRQEPQDGVQRRARRLRGRRHPLQVRQSRSDPDRRGRHHVCPGRLGLGLCDRRDQRQEGHVPLEVRSRHRQGLGRRRGLLRRQQPRRRAVEGQGDLDLARRPPVRHQQGDRREGVGAQDRRPGDRRDADRSRR